MFYTNIARRGNKIYHIGYKNGSKFINESKFKPSIYYESFDESTSTSIYNQPLKERKFDSITDYYQFVGQNKEILDLYSDVDPIWQFVSKKYHAKVEYVKKDIRIWYLDIEVYSEDGFPHAYLAEAPITSIALHDSKRDEFIVLGLKDFDSKKALTNLQNKFPTLDIPAILKKITYKKCNSEKDLLLKFIQLTEAFKPDIMIAHNGQKFDYPYIINRIDNIGLDSKELSPIGHTKTRYKADDDNFMSSKSAYYNDIDGISLLDNQVLYKKYVIKPRESWSLSNLAIEDLQLDKIDYEEYDNLNRLYDENHQLFIEYNIFDVVLMMLLNKKNGYIDLHIRNTYITKLPNFEDASSPVKTWDCYIYHTLQSQNIQIIGKKEMASFTYAGAFVLPVITRKLRWVITSDLNSLYPHIQMQWDISPEKLVEGINCITWLQSLTDEELDSYIKKAKTDEQVKFLESVKLSNDMGFSLQSISQDELDDRILKQLIPTHPEYIMSANGYYFKRGMGHIPELLFTNYNERKNIKKENNQLKSKLNKKYDAVIEEKISNNTTAEQGIKILMNSEYGALANQFFRWCKYELCSAVTLNGQLVLKTLLKKIESVFPDILICAGDTDSLIFSLEKYIERDCKNKSDDEIVEWIETFCKEQFQPLIDETYQQLAEYVGADKNFMVMEVEKIISDAFWTAKKHYAMRIVVEDGLKLSKPKFAYKGLECIKSSIPLAIRELQKQTIQAILTDVDSIHTLFNECESKIIEMEPTKIAFPKTCNNIKKYSDANDMPIKGAQAHVKAALAYNRYITENHLENEFPIIQEGDKIRFLWLKTPNVFQSETFGFINRLPNDPQLIDAIDYEKIIEKSYSKIINDMLERIGLQELNSDKVSVADFF